MAELVLRHMVGKSTLSQGFAIPREVEALTNAPAVGSKRVIELLFGDAAVRATLRRIDNAAAKVQVRYEGAGQAPIRDWLKATFNASASSLCGEYLELHRLSDDVFRIVPFPVQTEAPALAVRDWLFHRGASRMLNEASALNEVQAIVRRVTYIGNEGQSYYNAELATTFGVWGWGSESRIVPELGLRCDFSKYDTVVEVEFGNARTYYQDYVKFLLAFRHAGVRLGVLLVPSERFARHLCKVGRTRAVAKGRGSYSGMADFGKVRREFGYLSFMLTMPIAIGSIDTVGSL